VKKTVKNSSNNIIKKDYNLFSSLLDTAIIILMDYVYNPASTYLIFKDSINFVYDFYKNADDDLISKLIQLLEPIKYNKLPSIEYIKTDIPNKKGLRNSYFIQRDAKPIVELSNKIYDSSSSDIITYAQKSFDYVLNDIKYAAAPDQSAYGTLYYKKGVCYGKLNLYAALCRAKNIKTRFKIIPFKLTEGFEDFFLSLCNGELEFLKGWIEKFINIKMPHHFLEIYLDNEWINASPIQPAFIYDYLKIPSPTITGPNKKISIVKKGQVIPIFMDEIYPFFNILSGYLGRIKFGEVLNQKLDEAISQLI